MLPSFNDLKLNETIRRIPIKLKDITVKYIASLAVEDYKLYLIFHPASSSDLGLIIDSGFTDLEIKELLADYVNKKTKRFFKFTAPHFDDFEGTRIIADLNYMEEWINKQL